jgi:hypothetical protein
VTQPTPKPRSQSEVVDHLAKLFGRSMAASALSVVVDHRKMDEANMINEDGLEGQIRYLMEEGLMDDQIIQLAKEQL